jgi:hypothetical protein
VETVAQKNNGIAAAPIAIEAGQTVSGAAVRLRLGIASIGTWVLLSVAGLWAGADRWIADLIGNGFIDAIGTIGLFLLAHALIGAPFDIVGGLLLPRRTGTNTGTPSKFFRGWTRSLALHTGLLWVYAVALYAAATAGGYWLAALTAACGLMLHLVGQRFLATTIGTAPRQTRDSDTGKIAARALRFASADRACSGGIVGWPGMDQVVLPSAWFGLLPVQQLELMASRRHAAIDSGLRSRGVWLAAGWNLGGFMLVAHLVGLSGESVAEIFRLAFAMSLWTFLGLLLLPTPSRMGTHAVDRWLLDHSNCRSGDINELARSMSRLQDEEIHRSRAVESIFHPVPAAANRATTRAAKPSRWAAWNAARTMLVLSLPTLGLLSRAVHCNIGRPDLWMMPPAD